MIADVGKYLVSSTGRIGYALDNNGATFEEIELTDEFILRPDGSVSYAAKFNVEKGADLKKRLISKIWSNDDQIAIMLNRERSEDDEEMYDFMQQWRTYFGELAKTINSK